MKKLLLIAAILLSLPAWSQCSNTSLGNGWTCVWGGYNTGGTGVNKIFVDAIQAHDVLVGFCDTGNADNNGGHNVITDNNGDTWVQANGPIAWKSSPDGINGDATAGTFVVLDANAGSAGTVQATCSGSSQGAAFADIALAILRNTGGASPAIDAPATVSAVVQTTVGTCPYGGTGNLVPTITTTTNHNQELVVGMAQNGANGPTGTPSGWIWLDNIGYLFGTTLTSAGSIGLSYCLGSPEEDPINNAVEGLIGVEAPGVMSTTCGPTQGAKISNGAMIKCF